MKFRHLLITVAIGAISFCTLNAQTKGTQPKKQVNTKIGRCVSGNCINGYGTYIYPDTLFTNYIGPKVRKIKYVGNFVDSKREGQGTTYYSGKNEGEMARVEGIWKDDRNFDAVAYDAKNKVLDVIRGGELTSKSKEVSKTKEELPCAVTKEQENSFSHTHSYYEITTYYSFYIYSITNQDKGYTDYFIFKWQTFEQYSKTYSNWQIYRYENLNDAISAVNNDIETIKSQRGVEGYYNSKYVRVDNKLSNKPEDVLRFIMKEKSRKMWDKYPLYDSDICPCNGYIFK